MTPQPDATIHEGQVIIISRDNPPRVVTTLTATRSFNHQQVVRDFVTMTRARQRLGVNASPSPFWTDAALPERTYFVNGGPTKPPRISQPHLTDPEIGVGDDNEFIEWLISMGYVQITPPQAAIEWHVSLFGGVNLQGGILRPPGSFRPYHCAECGQGCFPEERVRVYGNPDLTAMRHQSERDLCKPCFQKISAEHADSQRQQVYQIVQQPFPK